jgi:hypothetical protein
MTFRHKPRPNTPLGQLIAGEISQAEYRRLLRAQAHRDDELERRPPTGPQDYARLGRHVVAPEPARPTSTSPDRHRGDRARRLPDRQPQRGSALGP